MRQRANEIDELLKHSAKENTVPETVAAETSLGHPVRRETRTTYSSGRVTVLREHFSRSRYDPITSDGSWGIEEPEERTDG